MPKSRQKAPKGKPYASRWDPKEKEIHRFLTKEGEPHVAWAYPHIHVIHEERTGKVTVVKSLGKRDHPEKISLHGNPSGNEVDGAIAALAESLRERSG